MRGRDRHLERGVFTMPFRDVLGRRIAVAIDSAGRCVEWSTFEPEERFRTYARLWSRLNQQEEAGLRS